MRNISFILFIMINMIACNIVYSQEMSRINFDTLAEAIYQQEDSSRYPYGIKSINTHGDKSVARQICLNTIAHRYQEWLKRGPRSGFIAYLGSTYAPSSDKADVGHLNANWRHGVKWYYNKIEKQKKGAI